jgi:hypothetical protein
MIMPITEKEILDFARQLAASENGCACSDEDPPEPTPEQYEYAKEHLVKESARNKG